jgi:hypothetical protein
LSDEKLAELLGLQTEYPELDFKESVDLGGTAGLVELAKDIGAMQVRGGYLILGVDGHGVPTDAMDGCNPQLFDEANLKAKLVKYMPEPLVISTRLTERDGHTVVVIWVAPNPLGCAVFAGVGQYQKEGGKPGEMTVVFREGEIFWRNGTSSVRISQAGLRAVVDAKVASAKAEWMEEQQELRRRDREEIEVGYEGRSLARAPIGTVNFALSADELRVAVLELVRAADEVALTYLLNDARPRAASAIERDEVETELGALLDKLAAIAALALEYEQDALFSRILTTLTQIYSQPLGLHDDRRFSMSTGISSDEKAPRVFLAVLERVYGLGALAVRLGRWEQVRDLTLQRPDRLDDYWANWLRHGQVMAARSQQLSKTENGRQIEISLLTRAAQVVKLEPALHPDTDDDDAILTSLAQFDLLANLAGIDGAGTVDDVAFYTNWARFRQDRVQPVADRVVTDPGVREAIFRDHNDEDLAVALQVIAKMAHQEGMRYDGFWGWNRTPVGEFIAAHPPRV